MRNKHPFLLFLLSCVLLLLTGCGTSRTAKKTATESVTARVELTLPQKGSTLTVSGTLRMVSGERMQLSFLMPILRSELVRIEFNPDELLLVDRMGKRYARLSEADLRSLLPKRYRYRGLEEMLVKAAKQGEEINVDGSQLGIPAIEKGKLLITRFDQTPLRLTPTELSARYEEVSKEELLELLAALLP